MKLTPAKTLFAIAVTLPLACVPAHAATILADFAADFSSTSNPGGPWSYGSTTTLGAAPTLASTLTHYGPGNEIHAWIPSATSWPTIALNTTGSPVSFGAGNAIIQGPHQGLLHPGSAGEFATVRYTATTTFTATLDAQFSGIDVVGTTTDVHILLNGFSLFNGSINTFGAIAAYTSTLNLTSGDVLDFAVGWGTNNNYIDDSTGFFATLSSVDAPEPSAWSLLALGLTVLSLTRLLSNTRRSS